ncbi:LmbE family N-acetylglucosaminyl deacetylase [Krasilnikovia cinnamomea]|uniref:LmbE family N-acetylglucosaminyl deacetylase n=1 Tax=Krasilnikovia cinnamomea TaxID=349313 RepID=A0A4Q7ZR77_9ACTN|nr:PIG-L deacetylase family protein [Krasilnikovia cinnamomea]RZU53314.1 LmbE family N-acetylglucosaminyl deacetylase [Krasilnikovia cinnamomea]
MTTAPASTLSPGELIPFPDDWDRALAIVAHPDDLEYGAAAAIAAWTAAGKQVSYLLATRGEAGIDGLAPDKAAQIREAEQHASAALVGVTSVEFLGHRDGLIEYGLPLRGDLTAAIRRHRPHLVVTFNHHDTWPGPRWNTPDHRHTGRAALDAIGDAGNRHLFADSGLEPWSGVRYAAVAGSPYASHAVDVTATLDTAVASLEAHRAYLDGLGPDNWMADARTLITSMAEQAGQRFGGRPAVAFELLLY